VLCLADDAALARVVIGATSVARAQRGKWLQDLAARFEGVRPTELSKGARYTRAWRARIKAGRCLLKFEADETETVVGLINRGLLDPLQADNPAALNKAAAKALALFCGETSRPGVRIRDELRVGLCLSALESKPRHGPPSRLPRKQPAKSGRATKR
jgi:hypothetical protein